MKNLFILVFVLFSLSSCVKDWTCDCVTVTTASEEYGGDTVTKKESHYMSKYKKPRAEEVCKGKEKNEQYPDGAIKSDVTTCDLAPF